MSKQDECQAKAQVQILCFALLILDQRKGFLVYFMSGYVVQETVRLAAVIHLLFLFKKNKGIRKNSFILDWQKCVLNGF